MDDRKRWIASSLRKYISSHLPSDRGMISCTASSRYCLIILTTPYQNWTRRTVRFIDALRIHTHPGINTVFFSKIAPNSINCDISPEAITRYSNRTLPGTLINSFKSPIPTTTIGQFMSRGFSFPHYNPRVPGACINFVSIPRNLDELSTYCNRTLPRF